MGKHNTYTESKVATNRIKSIDDLFSDALRHKLVSPPKDEVIKYLFEYACVRKERLEPTLDIPEFMYRRFTDIHKLSVDYYNKGDRFKVYVPSIDSIPQIIHHEQRLLKEL